MQRKSDHHFTTDAVAFSSLSLIIIFIGDDVSMLLLTMSVIINGSVVWLNKRRAHVYKKRRRRRDKRVKLNEITDIVDLVSVYFLLNISFTSFLATRTVAERLDINNVNLNRTIIDRIVWLHRSIHNHKRILFFIFGQTSQQV